MRRSKVDDHPRRAEIEVAIGRGVPLRKIGAQFGVSIQVLKRHKAKMKRDTPHALVAMAAQGWGVKPEELERLRVETSEGWLNQVRAHHSKCVAAFDRLLEAGNETIAMQASAQVLKSLAMLGQAVGEIAQHSTQVTNNFVLSPEFWRIRTALMRELRPYPEAHAAVQRALREVAADDKLVELTPERLPNSGQSQSPALEPPAPPP